MLLLTMNGEQRGAAFGLVLCCSLLVVPLFVSGQNLVPNPSFELTDTCPYTTGFQPGDSPLYWRSWLNSPEYFHSCAQPVDGADTLVGVPWNGWSFQQAYDGEAYAGFFAFSETVQYREYVGVELLEPLEIGETYQVSFRTNLAWEGSYWYTGGASNNVGLLFTVNSNAWSGLSGPAFPFRNYAHLYSSAIITDTVGWTLVSGSFTADSAYQHVVLGNFFDNAHTDVAVIPPGGGENTYYLIDEVCVSRQIGCDGTAVGEHAGSGAHWAAFDPASGNVLLTWSGQKRFNAEVIDLAGRVVGTGTSQGQALRISATSWGIGIYIARLRNGAQEEIVRFATWR
jgi:hypothetical protein